MTWKLGLCRGLHELQSKLLKGGFTGDCTGEYSRGYKGDRRGLDYTTYALIVERKISGFDPVFCGPIRVRQSQWNGRPYM